MNESDFRWVDDPTVALTSSGEVVVVWADQSRKDLFFQRYASDGAPQLEKPTAVSQTPATFSWLPRIAVSELRGSRIFVLWQEIVFSGGSHGGEIFFTVSSDAGRTFDAPINLSRSIEGDGKGRLSRHVWDNGSLDLAHAPDGALYAVWTNYEGALWFSASAVGQPRFSPARQIAGESRSPARGPSLAAGREGRVHVVWSVGESRSADVHYARSKDGGRSFVAEGIVFKTQAQSDTPKIALDTRGTLHLVYAETDAPESARYAIRYCRLRAGTTRFETPRVILGAERTQEDQSFKSPHLSVDAQGRVYVLAERADSPGKPAQGLTFTHSEDGGNGFAKPVSLTGVAGPELGFNSSQQGQLGSKLAANDAGLVAVVNSTFAPEKESHVWLVLGRSVARNTR
jgi:hypothetical protein